MGERSRRHPVGLDSVGDSAKIRHFSECCCLVSDASLNLQYADHVFIRVHMVPSLNCLHVVYTHGFNH